MRRHATAGAKPARHAPGISAGRMFVRRTAVALLQLLLPGAGVATAARECFVLCRGAVTLLW
jgi:hypothetical protein